MPTMARVLRKNLIYKFVLEILIALKDIFYREQNEFRNFS